MCRENEVCAFYAHDKHGDLLCFFCFYSLFATGLKRRKACVNDDAR